MIDQDVLHAFRDPDRRGVVRWAEEELTRIDGGRFSLGPVPYVREILSAYEDPEVEEITVVKTAQSGFTESVILPIVAYHVVQDPRDLLAVLPTIPEAEKWARAKLDRLVHQNPDVAARIEEGLHRTALLERDWPGGSLTLAGSNSGAAFRMVTIHTVIGDDVDGWARTAGRGDLSEGDQTVLARRRTDRIADRKLVWVSTPTRNDARIWSLYRQMERRGEWHVPCPQCGEMQVLTLRGNLRWEKRPLEDGPPGAGEVASGDLVHLPGTAWVECVNGCRVEESEKRTMAEGGAYLADDGRRVRESGARSVGYHFHGGLTVLLAGGEWSRLAEEFVTLSRTADTGQERRSRREKLRSFINTSLGETWERPSGRPAWEPLRGRREDWSMGSVPEGVQLLTAGCDWQQDRAVVEVVGWNWNRESWFIDYILVPGPDAVFNPTVRARVWEILTEDRWLRPDGTGMGIQLMAVDAGHWQNAVLDLATEGPPGKFWPIKGATRPDAPPQNSPSRRQRWPYVTTVNVAEPKHVLYAGLRMDPPDPGEPFPEGYVHLPHDLPDQVLEELTAEDFDRSPDARGFPRDRWINTHERPNEALDCWVYAYRAAERHIPRLPRGPESEIEETAPRADRVGVNPMTGRGRGTWLT